MDRQFQNNNGARVNPFERVVSVVNRSVLLEEAFRRLVSLERKRASRSRKKFLLTLLKIEGPPHSEGTDALLANILSFLASTTRETDVTGWYENDLTVGVMFTEIAAKDRRATVATVLTRLREHLRDRLTPGQFSQVVISSYVFPEERSDKRMPRHSGPTLHSYIATDDKVARMG